MDGKALQKKVNKVKVKKAEQREREKDRRSKKKGIFASKF